MPTSQRSSDQNSQSTSALFPDGSPILDPPSPNGSILSEVRRHLSDWHTAFDIQEYWQPHDKALSIYNSIIEANPEMQINGYQVAIHEDLENVELLNSSIPKLTIKTSTGDRIYVISDKRFPPDHELSNPEETEPYLAPRPVTVTFVPSDSDNTICLTSAKSSFHSGVLLGIRVAISIVEFRRLYSEVEFQRRSEMLLAAVYGWNIFDLSQKTNDHQKYLINLFYDHKDVSPTVRFIREGVIRCLRHALDGDLDPINPAPSEYEVVPSEYKIETNGNDRVKSISYEHPDTKEKVTLVTLEQYKSRTP